MTDAGASTKGGYSVSWAKRLRVSLGSEDNWANWGNLGKGALGWYGEDCASSCWTSFLLQRPNFSADVDVTLGLLVLDWFVSALANDLPPQQTVPLPWIIVGVRSNQTLRAHVVAISSKLGLGHWVIRSITMWQCVLKDSIKQHRPNLRGSSFQNLPTLLILLLKVQGDVAGCDQLKVTGYKQGDQEKLLKGWWCLQQFILAPNLPFSIQCNITCIPRLLCVGCWKWKNFSVVVDWRSSKHGKCNNRSRISQ